MAGVCVNVAFYGMWRTLALIGRAPGWLTGVLLVLGALSALLGIAHAAVQNRLSRVIAYSSIENTGLIVTGFGVALTGAAVGDPRLAAAGLLAATLQVVAHTAAKSLLFTSSAGIEAATGRDDLEELARSVGGRGGGWGTRWSGFGLAVGSVTLAGLPPTVGFVSEWFLLESLMQQFRVPGLGYRLVLALAGAAVALTVGFAGVTFVRLVGLIVLGRGTEPGSGRGEYGWAGRLAIVALALGCLGTAAITPLEIRVIAAGLSPVVPGSLTLGALKSPWILQPADAAADEDDVGDDGSGPPDRPDPGWEEAAAHLRYASDVMEVVETYLYRPAFGFFMALVTAAKRLQSGRLDAYLAYMLIALVAVIAVATALA